jgi:hypothetical protein
MNLPLHSFWSPFIVAAMLIAGSWAINWVCP